MNENFRRVLDGARRFLLTGHVRADGDCLGSEVALYHCLCALGKEPTILNPDPPAPRYAFLAASAPIRAFEAERGEAGVPPYDALVVLDVAVLDRTGPLAPILRARPAPRVAIDHHVPDGKEAWDASLLDEAAPSTGVLVYRLSKSLGVRLPLPALEAVFVSLTTDTGWFKYGNTTAEALGVASELAAAGVDPAAVYRKVYQQYPPSWARGIAAALSTLRYEVGGRLAVVALDRATLAAFGAEGFEDPEEVLDLLRAVGPVEVVLFVRELEDGSVKASFRSKGDFDVNALARTIGGGGHRKAAGAEAPGPFAETAPGIAERTTRAVEAWTKEGRRS